MNFCTLFNAAYLSRGLAMYRSLLETGAKFHLYIYAFDDHCYEYFTKAAHEHITVIPLNEFEDEKLLAVKQERTATEYCWTCTPLIIAHCISRFNLYSCTYIDADLYFYSDPSVLLSEMGDHDVLITDHRYTAEYNKQAQAGRFCVQFMNFRNTAEGMAVLKWWCDACIVWCYNREEDGKFGDQKYLDDWPQRFPAVHILEHLGGGVAPWNVQQYRFRKGKRIGGTERATGNKFALVFYHYHGVRFYENNIVSLSDYKKTGNVLRLLYRPYLEKLLSAAEEIKKLMPGIDPNGTNGVAPGEPRSVRIAIKYYLQDLRRAGSLLLGVNLVRSLEKYPFYKIK